MRVLVCGGRDYYTPEAWKTINEVLNAINEASPIEMIIHGAAKGADAIAGQWARASETNCLAVPAKWRQNKKAAGPIRNSEMLDYKPNLVVAFPGGRGTADMVKKAKEAGVAVEMHETRF